MTNEELVARIQRGERDRLPELWERMKDFVGKQASKRARILAVDGYGGVTCEDLCQSAYIALVDAVEDYNPAKCSFSSWLYFDLIRVFAETGGYRTTKRDPLQNAGSLDTHLKVADGAPITLSDFLPDTCADQDFQDVEDRIWRKQLRAALDTALAELPDEQAETLRRHYYMGQSLEQIGKSMGVHKDTAFKRNKKALQTLRQCRELQRFAEARRV